MSTAMEELNKLNTEEESQNSESRPSMKEEMMSALQEMKDQERKSAEEEQQAQNLEKIQRKQALEREEMNEVYQEVQAAYKEEVTKDPSFQKVLSEKELSGDILEYVMEVGDPNDALLVIRELAGSDEYQEKWQKTQTPFGRRRLISKIHKNVLSGSTQNAAHPMIQANVTHLNPNNSYSTTSDDYADLSQSLGIS